MRLRLPLLFLLLGFAGPASAHPLTDFRFDRAIAARLSPEVVEVTYTLELSPLAMHLDAAKRLTPAEIAALDRTTSGYARAYARKVAPELTEKLRITVDGEQLLLNVATIDVTITDHAVCRFTLRAAWPPGGRERTLVIADGTFAGQPGVVNLTLDRKGGNGSRVELLDIEEPPIRVRTRPLGQLTPEEVALAHKASATIALPVAIAPRPHEYVPGATPDGLTQVTPTPTAEPVPEPVVNADAPPTPDLFTDLSRRGLPALFDSTLGTGLLLLAAFLFGAAHAFTPGHGKTLVAAYLIGERGTVRHAILLAVATTIAHTGSVLAVAAILWSVYGNNVPGRTQGTLQFLAGLMVIGVGLWLLLRRVTGQADHFHLFAGHHHHGPESHVGPTVPDSVGPAVPAGDTHPHSHGHGHDHPHPHPPGHSHDHTHPHTHDHGDGHHHHGPRPEAAKTTGGWLRILLMGLGGGIVPCWDAVLLLVAATAMNRVGFAVPLLLAFSAGLGAVLVALGIGVVYAYRAGSTRFKERRWFQVLPMLSAVFLVGVGFWLCKQAVRMAG